jgi:hypothetical protein
MGQQQRVINFSGGKTSAYMTIKEYKPGDIVLFCDTGREHPKTYKFINDFEAFENIPVTRIRYMGRKLAALEKQFAKGFLGESRDLLYFEIARVNKIPPFELFLSERGNKTLPNRMRRLCTETLKVLTARRYMVSIGHKKYENLIGFRYDEPKRVLNHKEKLKSVKTLFPLYEAEVTKEMINAFWMTKPYTLEIPGILGNCTLCFMKGKNAIMAILREFPELAEPWIADEEMNLRKGHTYLPGVTIRQLRDVAQNNLFKGYDLGDVRPSYDCACTT